ncbi:class I SAM-dependent RNA methyltransferase [Mycoplasma marinum]|uniref:Class I SAM-dependent RNA methyltransferase n=1 Tax=Mycoplasma marinum TaxID=1937190 RepID=A0A4R0XXJ8_9MOLU|nr:methyltransferase domain-containing protein [Mycoplasma marinum]TCG11754.1 class I SAM-dependent RNA methyltransferase [Mycoplasma marinum]
MKITCIGYNSNGEGIAKYNDKVFYVPGLIKGESAKCSIEFEKEKWGRAKVEEILEPSILRNYDLPKNHLEIGGYEIMHMNREEQTNFKINKIINDFKQNAKTEIKLDEIFIGDKQFRYRNKVTLHNGGFHKRGTNQVIKMEDFLLTDIDVKNINKKGNYIIRKLDTQIEGYRGENKFTTDTMLGIEFIIKLDAFYQVNKEVAIAAYSKMLEFIEDNMIVFDLYSGIGTITLLAAQNAKKVYGIERNNASHSSAILNKENNNTENVEFVKEDVMNFLKETSVKPDVVIVDPARSGLGKEVCASLLELLPKTIIYLSCNPGTQAADFFRLKDKYEITYAKPFDMFPQTHHIENLIILKSK